MSEFGIATLNPLDGNGKVGSVGKAIAGYELSIRDADGKSAPVGKQGRLWVRCPELMAGYWNQPESTREVLVDGWLDTGDVMRQDEDGYFWFQGRQKQLIVHDGSNIAPQEVEEALLLHPAVAMAGVVGVADVVHGECIRAFVKLKPLEKFPTACDLIDFARAKVGYKAPSSIIVLQDMPMTASERVDRVVLRRLSDTMS